MGFIHPSFPILKFDSLHLIIFFYFQGLLCSLSDVAPQSHMGWTPASIKAFEKMARNTLTKVYIDEVNEFGLSVALYKTEKDKDICINGLLVKKGYANSIGRK